MTRHALSTARARARERLAAQPKPARAAPPFDVAAYVEEEADCEDTEFVVPACAISDEDPPFDPPDEEAGVLSPEEVACVAEAPAPTPAPAAPQPPAKSQRLPAISIYASWDRVEAGAELSAFARDPALARARVALERGGLDAAIARCAAGRSPDLVIVDTTLAASELMAGLGRLRRSLPPTSRIVVVGAHNDIALLRTLSQRGVSEYSLAPLRSNTLVATASRLFAQNHRAKVIAVMGARGGIGASSLARSLAWSIAERHDAGCTLIDFDFAFGAPNQASALASYALLAQDVDALLDAAAQPSQRLLTLAAPASLAFEREPDPRLVANAVQAARRSNPFVVLDLPHKWTPWVRRALVEADEAVIVAGPDLASLRNADGILKELKSARGRSSAVVAMTMIGVPKRPEIAYKDFVEAVGEAPVAMFAFEPDLYGAADTAGAALGALAPRSRAAAAVDDLASALTGLRRQPARNPVAPPESAPPKSGCAVRGRRSNGAAITRRAQRSGKPKRRGRGYLRMAACIAVLFALIALQSRREGAVSQPSAELFDFPVHFAANVDGNPFA